MTARPLGPVLALALAATLGLARTAAAQQPERVDPEVLEQAWRAARDRFYDRGYHGVDWPGALTRYRPAAAEAKTRAELHAVIEAMLGELGASHAEVLEQDVYALRVAAEVKAQPVLQYGMVLTQRDEGLFVSSVLIGGAAEAAGVKRGDRIVAIDGEVPSAASLWAGPREAGLDGDRTWFLAPPKASAGEEPLRRLDIERFQREDGRCTLTLRRARWNEVEASRASARVFVRGGVRIGYMRLYHVLIDEPVAALEAFLASDELADAEAFILDLRGRGGIPAAAERAVRAFDRRARGAPFWSRPAVALIDGQTRSAKELLAQRWRTREIGPLVGANTRGAVLGATFIQLRDGAQLMLPVMDMRATTNGVVLEGKGVAPDVAVAELPLPFSEGRDPILERGLEVALDEALARRRAGRQHGWH